MKVTITNDHKYRPICDVEDGLYINRSKEVIKVFTVMKNRYYCYLYDNGVFNTAIIDMPVAKIRIDDMTVTLVV
jgi:hypothetical protein